MSAFLSLVPVFGQPQVPAVGRPILFVHGICDTAASWSTSGFANGVAQHVANARSDLYTDQSLYPLYYDGVTVRNWFSGNALSLTEVPADARFFAIDFHDPSWSATPTPSQFINATQVAGVSILNKADELAHVIGAITAFTKAKDVIVIAHSQGGLEARAYLEQLAVPSQSLCTSADSAGYTACLQAGRTLYTQDIAKLITLDTPHSGVVMANFVNDINWVIDWAASVALPTYACIASRSLNREELDSASGTSYLIPNLLNGTAYLQNLQTDGVPITAMRNFTDPGFWALPQGDDAVVSTQEQSIADLVSGTNFADKDTNLGLPAGVYAYLPFTSVPTANFPLHLLTNLSSQGQVFQSLYEELDNIPNGLVAQPTSVTVTAPSGTTVVIQGPSGSLPLQGTGTWSAYQVAVGAYTVISINGVTPPSNFKVVPALVQILGVDHASGTSSWNPTFTIYPPSGQVTKPSVTSTVTSTVGDGATISAQVNPNGGPATVWFQYSLNSVNSNLISPTSTLEILVGTGTTLQTVPSYTLSGLTPNTLYYYQAVANNASGTTYGAIQPFSTLPNLPKPSSLTPSNEAPNVLTPPTFTWSSNPNATSYRFILATDASALPTDPTSPVCVAGCVINATPQSPSYMPPAVLAPSSVYYWEVHDRSPTQFGFWSDIYEFTTAPAVSSVTINTTSINSGQSGSGTVFLTGAAPSGGANVTLTASTSGLLQFTSPVTVATGSESANFSFNALTVSNSTSVLISAAYNNVSQSAVVTVNPSSASVVPSNLSFTPASATGGSPVSGAITLSGPAPAGGASFTFASSPSGLIQFPTVTVAAGSSSQTFTATTSTVTSSTPITATASYGGGSTQGAITLTKSGGSVVLSSLAISPSSVVGGVPALGIVTFTGPAPSGATVALSNNNTHFVQIPSSNSVTATPGYSSVTFPIATEFTSGTVGATITASYNSTTYGASLTVLPVAVAGVTFSPTSVTSGGTAQFTVYLNGPAPAGASISLVSSSPSVLQVIPSVTVLPGATSVMVNATALNVAAQTNVSVTASYNSSSAQGSVSVIPIMLDWLSLSQDTATGGTSITGTVQLNGNAPAGGVNVVVSSSSPALTPFISPVNVVAGAAIATFTIPTSAVGALTEVTITASYGASSSSVILTLVPPLPFLQSMTISPGTVNGGSQATGTVTLTAPAPVSGSTGASVILTTSFFAIANVANMVYVQPGATTATFPINTTATNFIEPVTITATYNGITQTQMLNVVPAGTPLAPGSLTLSPLMLTGGSSATATLTLTEPAPAGGVTLTITSDNPAIQVVGQITVPAGSTFASFMAATSPVTAITTATIRVSLNGISQSSLLTVRPSAAPARNPSPFLTSPLSPESQVPGTARQLQINGTGFVSGATAYWNDTALSTTFTNGTQITASVPASLGQLGSVEVSVANPGPGSARSNPLPAHTTFPQTALAFGSSTIAAPSSAGVLATGDFNGDSIPDVVIGDGGQAPWVYLGNGDGTFSGPLILPAGAPTGVVVADFNGDGKSDLGFVNGAAIRIFLGNGDGTFTQIPDTPLPAAPGQQCTLAAGDFNGDGAVDLAVTGSSSTNAYVLLGKGDGTFGAAAAVGSLAAAQSLAIGDFNGDGKLDLVLTDSPNQSVAVLLGNGDGTFQSQHEYPTNGYAIAVTVADFNGDGHPDIAVANQGPCCGTGAGAAVLLNSGAGTFLAPTTNGPGQNYSGVVAEDIDGDGKTDLVALVYQPTPALLVFHGNGDGTFAATPFSIPISDETSSFGVADLNGDGAPDILATDVSGILRVMLQTISPVLEVSPNSITVPATQGGLSPAPLPLTISNPGSGTLNWTATISTQTWGVLSQTSGTAPSTLNLIIDTSGLAPGTYSASITITGSGSNPLSQSIPVSLTVAAPPAVLAALTFDSTAFIGPRSLTGTVTLSAAPAGGVTVALSSSNPSVQVPLTMSVGAGQSFGTFSATAIAVTAQTSVTVTASYDGGQATNTLTVNPPAGQTITFSGLPSQPFGAAPFTVSATATSGLAVGFASTTASVCTVSGSTVTLVSVGACTIQATQAGNANWGAAPPVSQSFQVIPGPSPVSVTPGSGSGAQATFALQYADTLGATDLSTVWVWFTSNFNSGSSANSCLVYYARAANQLFLLNDAGAVWSPAAPGAAVTLSNSQCSIDAVAASVMPSGTNLTLNLPVTFTAAYAGAKSTYMYAAGSGANSGWQAIGTWTVPATAATVTTVSVTPGGSSGAQQTFALHYADTLGATDLSAVWVWFTSNFNTVSSANSCIAYYARATNQILLINDAGTAYTPATPGSAVTLSNSNCSINAVAATVTLSGVDLTLNLPMTFAAGFAGAKSVFMFALGSSANSGWQPMGTWTVPLGSAPAPGSVTPGSGSVLSQTFALLYADSLGATDLSTVWVWFTSTFNTVSSANSCIAYYASATNQINLINDAGTAILSSAPPGAEVTLSNSQCSINAAAATVVPSGNNLTVNLPVTFTAGYAGAKGIFMFASGLSANSGWQSMGTWTVP
jgi:pimeloyl-ACP methyl ester carboxylesterase